MAFGLIEISTRKPQVKCDHEIFRCDEANNKTAFLLSITAGPCRVYTIFDEMTIIMSTYTYNLESKIANLERGSENATAANVSYFGRFVLFKILSFSLAAAQHMQ